MPADLLEASEQLKFQYEHLEKDSLGPLLNCYAQDAIFKDPFQEVQGHEAISHVFMNMFNELQDPKFIVREILLGQHQASLLWDFHFSMRRWNTSPQSFLGVSWLYFDDQFLVKKHIDYWDPASGIYEHLPLIGPVMRALKKRA
jgi:steroid delta-isomerase